MGAETKPKSFTMKEKFTFHANRTKGQFPIGKKMTGREKAAYSMGWLNNAKANSRINDYKEGIERDKDGKRIN